MGTQHELYKLWAAARREEQAGALVTLVEITGSSYQPIGARMLVTAAGAWAGTISGGCLEADVLARAREVMARGQSQCFTYDARAEADVPLGFNLGCQGRITVLIEPLPATGELLAFLMNCREAKTPGVIGTVIAAPGGVGLGQHVFLWDRGDAAKGAAALALPGTDPGLHAADAFASERSLVVVYGDTGATTVLWEYVRPPLSLLICGAGEDARPLCAFSHALSWEVTLVDHRPAYLTAERFPEVQQRYLWTEYPAPPKLPWRPDASSAAVVMTHNFERDQSLLAWLLRTPCPYLGVLGPKSRTGRLFAALRAESSDASFGPSAEQRLHSPIGLDVGAESPEAIAIAIAAEVHAVLAGRLGGSLCRVEAPLHQRLPTLQAAQLVHSS